MKIVKNIYVIVILMVLISVQPIAAQQNQKGNTKMGCLIVLNKSANTTTLIDLNTDQPIKVLPTSNGPHEVAVSPDGQMAVAGIYGTRNEPGDSLLLIDLNKHRIVETIKLGQFQRPHGLVFLSKGNRLLVTAEAQKALLLVDLDKKGPDKIMQTFPIRLKFTPDGSQVLVSNARSGDVAVFDTKSYQELYRVPMKAKVSSDTDKRLFKDAFGKSPVPIGILMHPTGKWAYVANAYVDKIAVIDLKERKLIKWITAGKEPDGLAFAPHGMDSSGPIRPFGPPEGFFK